ncbi:MAG TPA: efflux RND transporter periplasmic adaptor subunit, partial [Burkholderiales bacterium]|nr:efflux RND transporter periplasmic adaptor subunit [Burkholderiales bacterium]
MLAAKRVRVACAILLATALLGGCGKKEAPPVTKGPVEVTVVTVAPRDVPAVFEYVGTTQSSRQVNIQARVSGFLDKRV